jgi:hypothetical protein
MWQMAQMQLQIYRSINANAPEVLSKFFAEIVVGVMPRHEHMLVQAAQHSPAS